MQLDDGIIMVTLLKFNHLHPQYLLFLYQFPTFGCDGTYWCCMPYMQFEGKRNSYTNNRLLSENRRDRAKFEEGFSVSSF